MVLISILLRHTSASHSHMAAVELSFIESFRHNLWDRDGALSFEEACVQVQGQKLLGPLVKPLKADRPAGDVCLIDLPLQDLASTCGKFEQFVDIIQNHLFWRPLKVDQAFLALSCTPYVHKASIEIFQNLLAWRKNPMCPTACSSSLCQLSPLQIRITPAWIFSSMSICTRTRCGLRTWLHAVMGFLSASTGAINHAWHWQPWTTCLIASVASKYAHGQMLPHSRENDYGSKCSRSWLSFYSRPWPAALYAQLYISCICTYGNDI